MTAYGPRAIVKNLSYTDIGSTAKTFDIKVPAGFWVDQCFAVPVTDFVGYSALTVDIGKYDPATNTATAALFSVAGSNDIYNISAKPVKLTATADSKSTLDGQGCVDLDSEGTIRIVVTPTGTPTAGAVKLVILGHQLPVPA